MKVGSPGKKENEKQLQFDILMRHYTEICEPYEYEKENATTGGIEIIKKLSDCINTDRSLLKLVKIFLKDGLSTTAKDGDDVVDEDEDQ